MYRKYSSTATTGITFHKLLVVVHPLHVHIYIEERSTMHLSKFIMNCKTSCSSNLCLVYHALHYNAQTHTCT